MSEKPATEEEYEQVYEHEHDDEPIETKRIPSHVTEEYLAITHIYIYFYCTFLNDSNKSFSK